MDEILALISQFGFPIVMCLLLFYQSNTDIKELREVIRKNTQIIDRLLTHLEGKEDENSRV